MLWFWILYWWKERPILMVWMYKDQEDDNLSLFGCIVMIVLDLQFSEEMSWRQAIYERRDSWDKERTWEREQRARRGALGGRILTLHLSSLVAVPLQCVPSWDTRWHTHKQEHMQVQAISKLSKVHLSSLVAVLQAIIRKPSKLYMSSLLTLSRSYSYFTPYICPYGLFVHQTFFLSHAVSACLKSL